MAEPILSYELKGLIDYIKTKLIIEFPIKTITLNYLILAILDNTNCDGYNVLSKIMIKSSIDEFKQYIAMLVLADCQSGLKKDEEQSKFSEDYDKLTDEISESHKTITSAWMFYCIIKQNDEFKKKLNSLGVTLEQLSDIVIAYSNRESEDIKPSKKNKKKVTLGISKSSSQYQYSSDINYNKHILINDSVPELSTIVDSYCINLNRMASKGNYDNIIGYDDIINDIYEVLTKNDRNTIALIGPNGVGKTSIARKLAKKIFMNECPKSLKDKQVVEISGEIDAPLIIEMNTVGKYIAFFDDTEKFFLNKESESTNAYNLSKFIQHPYILSIMCMTDTAYNKYIESRPTLARLIHKIKIDVPTDEELVDIIKHSVSDFGNFNISNDIIKESIRLSERFISSEKCPKSAINILDMASSHVRFSNKKSQELINLQKEYKEILDKKDKIPNSGSSEEFNQKDELIRKEIELSKKISSIEDKESNIVLNITSNDVKYAVSKITGIPISDINADERSKLKNLYNNLTNVVIGQDEAVNDICRAVKRQRVGLANPNSPCVMLYVGKSGVGKTFLAKRLAYEMFGNENKMVRLDMSEYAEKSSVSKLYGSSMGYIGFEEGGILTEAIKKTPYCVLLLDEIEKAHSDVFDAFLQIFDEGQLTDNHGVKVDFRNTIIIMTSNVGAVNVVNNTNIGFSKSNKENTDKDIILKAIKNKFKPEFINRIDNICYFNTLTDDNLKKIIINEIEKVHQKVINIGYDMNEELLTGKSVDNIFEKIKEQSEYGARPIIREIQKQIEDKITDYIIDNDIEKGFIFKYNDIYNK